MIKKFECKQCGHHFEADENSAVTCPNCHSDNVDLATFHLPSWTWKAVAAAVALVLIGLGAWFLFSNTDTEEPAGPAEELFENEDTDSVAVVPGLTIPPTVKVSTPVFDEKEQSYSVEVKVDNIPSGFKYYYVMLNHFGEQKVLQKSDDGKFTGIPYNEEDGNSYDFAVMDAKADTLLCVPVPTTGFIRQAKVAQKMSVAALQELLDKEDESLMGKGENDYLAPDYKLKFVGLPSDAVNVPKVLADVIQKIKMMSWEKATVTDLEYDDMNRISAITIKVVVDDF